MSEPTKDNAAILADQRAFQEAYARAREFFGQIEGVVGVGFGLKETSGQYQDSIAILVYVRAKQPEEELAPEQRIPSTFEGYRTDVKIALETRPGACDNTASYDTIQGGIQIAPPANAQTGSVEYGTLGCIVRKRNDSSRENVYLLSNKHVLFRTWAGAGNYIYHPFPPAPAGFASPGPAHTLGPIQELAFYANVPYTIPGDASPTNFFIDCATARIDIDSKCFGSTCTKDVIKYGETIIDLQVNNLNTMSDVRSVINDPSIIFTQANPRKVFKVGRTSSKTQGKVVSVNIAFNTVGDPSIANSPAITGQNGIEIAFDTTSTANELNCKGHAWFAEQGDSGSIVVDEQNRVIGIISQVPPPGSPIATTAVACHILPVLDKLNICIPTTGGTSHGSCAATDGSGLAAAAVASANGELVEGELALASQTVAGMLASAPGFPSPAPATDEELQHLYAIRDALYTTTMGRELHDAFIHVRREIGYLVRSCRPVKLVWHRNKGPAFFAHVLNHLQGHTDRVPREVDGVALSTLLTRMGVALSAHGSLPLHAAIEQHGADLLLLVASGDRVQDYIAYLQQREAA